jgi:hypothetical protein
MDVEGIDGQAFNLSGDVYLSAREYVSLLAEHSLRDFRFFPRNVHLYYAAEAAKSIVKLIIRRRFERGPTMRNLKSSTMATRIDNSRAKKVLKWSPNSDLSRFVQMAIIANMEPIPPGDLRLSQPEGEKAWIRLHRWRGP